MIKIAISTPTYGETFHAPYVQSLFRLTGALERRNWGAQFASISYAEISEARNFLLTRWFDKSDATHILFIDADMGFDPQLVLDMVDFNHPVVGAVYPKRQLNLHRIVDLAAKHEPADRAIARGHDFIAQRLRGRQHTTVLKGFIEVEGCGAGILLIQRACIEAMLKAIPEIDDKAANQSSPLAAGLDRLIRAFDPLTVDGARLSEDFAFCHRWRLQCGGEIWANIAHPITHVGLHRFSARYADVMQSGPRVALQTSEPVKSGRVYAAATGNGLRSAPASGIRRVVTGRLPEQ